MNLMGLSKRCHFLAQNLTVVLSLHKKEWILNISTYQRHTTKILLQVRLGLSQPLVLTVKSQAEARLC